MTVTDKQDEIFDMTADQKSIKTCYLLGVQTKINPGFYLHMIVFHLCDVTFSIFNIYVIHVNVIPNGVVSVVYTV